MITPGVRQVIDDCAHACGFVSDTAQHAVDLADSQRSAEPVELAGSADDADRPPQLHAGLDQHTAHAGPGFPGGVGGQARILELAEHSVQGPPETAGKAAVMSTSDLRWEPVRHDTHRHGLHAGKRPEDGADHRRSHR